MDLRERVISELHAQRVATHSPLTHLPTRAPLRTGEPCLICDKPISMQVMTGRKLYWCATCQVV
ncbi:MAG: zinc finger domain-containing protein [Janthinobacterium lividum]